MRDCVIYMNTLLKIHKLGL